MDYLKSINERHEEWLAGNERALVLNGDIDFEHSNEVAERLLKQVEKEVSERLFYPL